MVYHHHHGHHRKQDSGDLSALLLAHKKPTLLRLFLLFSLFSFSFISLAFLLFPYYSSDATAEDNNLTTSPSSPCSSIPNNTICCDRFSLRTDLCFLGGPLITHSSSNSLLLLSNSSSSSTLETIRPYTRKWESNTMSTIDQLNLRTANATLDNTRCDVYHDVPAVVLSTGGYTGNVYHEFNDGIIPLYITSRKFNRKVVFVILEYHDWWISKYEGVIAQLSDYAPIDFTGDKRAHCFSEAVVGLKIHDELTVDDNITADENATIRDFRNMLDEAYKPRIKEIVGEEASQGIKPPPPTKKPKMVIVSRNGSRGIENEDALVAHAESVGFVVEVLRPQRTTELAKIYRMLNSSDIMIGVHGAAMTHLLFMRPGTVFIQVVPLGTDWAAESYYGAPAVKLGLKYVRYGIAARESSLYREYAKDDPVLTDPESVNAKGWEVTKKVYLDGQNVRLDLERFRKRLVKAHQYLVGKNNKKNRKTL